jgi:two-component system, OmpR family, alkaline phosphatase synthesis response regulator PhoP
MRVLLFSKRQKLKLWAILPFEQGMRRATGLAPPRREAACMDALSQLFPAHYGTHRVAATPHFSADRRRERGRSCWTLVQAECHESSIVEMLSEVLEEEGYEVITANNGLEGLNRLQSARPAVVMSDVMMPVLDGKELCRRMQADQRLKSIPIVLMSAVRSASHLKDCTYAAILKKPFEINEMLREDIQATETSLSLTVRATRPTSCCPLCSQAHEMRNELS